MSLHRERLKQSSLQIELIHRSHLASITLYQKKETQKNGILTFDIKNTGSNCETGNILIQLFMATDSINTCTQTCFNICTISHFDL